MRILIDLQACQTTGSRHRGIGRYSMALAKAMARNAGSHDLRLMLNGVFEETIIPIRQAFSNLIPDEHIYLWQTPGPAAELVLENTWRRRTGELVWEQAMAQVRPDYVHVTSLFEGSVDDAISSVGRSGLHLPTAVTLYDLIPYVYADKYLDYKPQRQWYLRKLQALKAADLSLAISESSRLEGIEWLHLPPERVVNISTAVDGHFRPTQYSEQERTALRQKYHLYRPFVMYTGGIDQRKNLEALIRAYAALPIELRRQHQLAIVCSAQPLEMDRLKGVARRAGLAQDELVLTGFVPEVDLLALYNLCRLFVFPSWHEGFGLPALEAMSCGVPVIAANTSSLPEVMGRTEAMFDPRNEREITAKMAMVLTDTGFLQRLQMDGLEQAKKFSWDVSAKRAISAIEADYERQKAQKNYQIPAKFPLNKPRLAYFSPLPPERSGIADYSADLLPELARYYEIDLIVAQNTVEDDWLNANFRIRDCEWFEEHATTFDRVLYNFGNSLFHGHMFDLLKRYPGVVILHDFFLSGIISHLEMIGEMPNGWTQALYLSHGYPALIDKIEAKVERDIIAKYPCNLAILERAEGVIVHSQHAVELAKKWYGANLASSWKTIPLIRCVRRGLNRDAVRAKLGLKEDDFLFCTFGALGPTKLNLELMEAWRDSSLALNSKFKLVFVGGGDHDLGYKGKLLNLLKNSELEGQIKITNFADPELFRDYLTAADGAIQLRTMSRGETSAAVLDCMAYGLPTIVNAHGSMRELPSDTVIFLPDQFSQSELIAQLEAMSGKTHVNLELGKSAKSYISDRHAPAKIGQNYFTTIESFFNCDPGTKLHNTVQKLAQIDCAGSPSNEDLIGLAHSLASNNASTAHRQIFLDISCMTAISTSSLSQSKLISILRSILNSPFKNGRVETVAMSQTEFYYARNWTCEHLQLPALGMKNGVLETNAGDTFVTSGGNISNGSKYREALVHFAVAGVQRLFFIDPLLLEQYVFDEKTKTDHDREQWIDDMIQLTDAIVFDGNLISQNLPVYLMRLFSITGVQDIQIGLGEKTYFLKSNNCGLLSKFI